MTIVQTELRIDKTLSDDELFTLMSLKDEDEESAKRAFDVFYEKYARLLWALCYNVCSWFRISDSATMAKEIFQNTMIKIHQNPSYDSSKAKISTWMSSIAKREALNLVKLSGNDLYIEEECFLEPDISDETEEGIVLPEKKILEEALDTLSDQERDILRTYMRYQLGNKHLPDSVLKELAEYYKKKTDNIRQIKKRALDKVKSYIKQNSDFLS